MTWAGLQGHYGGARWRLYLWAPVVVLLWTAAVAKILHWNIFTQYLTVVFPITFWPSEFLGLSVFVAELATPVLGFFPRTRSFAMWTALALFSAYGLFNAARWAAGDRLPCQCFGSALSTAAPTMLALNVGAAFLSWLALGQRIGSGTRRAWSNMSSLASIAVVLLAAAEVRWVMRSGAEMKPWGTRVMKVSVTPQELISGARLLNHRPYKGVALVLFGDLDCPYTQKLLVELPTFLRDVTVPVYWRESPLRSLHPTAYSWATLSKIQNAHEESAETLFSLAGAAKRAETPDSALVSTTGHAASTVELDQAHAAVEADMALARRLDIANLTPVLVLASDHGLEAVATLSIAAKEIQTGSLGAPEKK